MNERQQAGSDSEFFDRITGNPIHAYKMIKRFAVDWKKLEADLNEDDWKGESIVGRPFAGLGLRSRLTT